MLSSIVQITKYFRGLDIVKVASTYSYIQTQEYSRFTSRRPAAIVNEDELFDVEEAAYPKERETSLKKKNEKFHDVKKKSSFESDSKEEVMEKVPAARTKKRKIISKPKDETSTRTMFSKLYENEKLLSPLVVEVKSKKQREKHRKILLEGVRLISDAIQAGNMPELIIFTKINDLEKLPLPKNSIPTYKVTYRAINLWSSLTTPPGIMGIFNTPEFDKFKAENALPITIICDNVRDPGNLGSILRAAAGVGCAKVVLTKGCADLWDQKVLRSAAGAHFRLLIENAESWNEIRQSISKDSFIVIADSNVGDLGVDAEENESDFNETKSFVEEVQTDPSILNSNEKAELMKKKNSRAESKNNELMNLSSAIPVVPYYAVDYTQNEIIIIVGGETEGLSEESFKLVSDAQGMRINIPLDNGVESLNTGMALGIIAFEIKRQFLKAASQDK